MSQDWQKPLKFPEREIVRYAEYVRPADLKVGEVYFRLSYVDDEMRIPELVALVYVGRDLFPEADGAHCSCFQDAASYFAGRRWNDPPEPRVGDTEEERFENWLSRGHFESFYEADGGGVLVFEKALDLLLLCFLERRGATNA